VPAYNRVTAGGKGGVRRRKCSSQQGKGLNSRAMRADARDLQEG